MADEDKSQPHWTCKKCNTRHYGYEPCVTNDGPMSAAAVIRQPRPGFREGYKDRLRTVTITHGAVDSVRLPRKHATTGRVTDENGRTVKLPPLPAAKATLTYPEGVK